MKVKEIIEVTKGKLIIGDMEEQCDKFSRDTRIIQEGDTYIGIKGENFDGNKLWEEALEKGAKTVIVQGIDFEEAKLERYKDKNIIQVEDTLKALADIATYKRTIFGKEFPLIGVTGSVGKTSTKDIIASVVSQKCKTLKTQGNNNNEIGLPFTIFNLSDHQAAVIEMGMNHLGEISRLAKIAQPTISVITNVGTSHIGNLGSRENILKAKLEILDGMEKKILIINNDNDLLHKWNLDKDNNDNVKVYTYGIENESEIMAEDIVLNENNSEFTCDLRGEKFKVKVPVGGIHFVYNALCAVTVGNIIGLSIEQIKKGIESFELTKKRMDITELKNGVTIINDSYNASFESMQASLKYLGSIKDSRKIAVLGDMFELGEYSEELHKKVGIEVARNKIDILLCCGDNSKYIAEMAKDEGLKEVFHFENKKDMEKYLTQIWEKGDTILFKASNGMKFFEIVENLLKIDEVSI